MIDASTAALPPESASDDQFLLAFLDSHESACPACGYNCHKLLEPRCPECGISLTLRLVSLDALRKSWATAMVGAALAAGVGVLLLLLISQKGWPHEKDVFRQITYIVTFSYFIGMMPGAVLLLALRRSFERLSCSARIAAAITLLLLTFVMLIWLGLAAS